MFRFSDAAIAAFRASYKICGTLFDAGDRDGWSDRATQSSETGLVRRQCDRVGLHRPIDVRL
jgi:hypothetical protein